MKTTTSIALLLATTLTASGCASIISGSSKPVVITSVPEGQAFAIQNKQGQKVHTGITPATVNLETGAGFFQKAKYTVTYSPEGATAQTVTSDASLNPWYLGNLLVGGWLGILIIDPATGAMWSMPKTITNSPNLAMISATNTAPDSSAKTSE